MNNIVYRSSKNKKDVKILYITYDGLLDQLGQSQVLPYLIGLTNPIRKFYIISFEKKKKIVDNDLTELKKYLETKNIYWKYFEFTNKYGFFGKVYDLLLMYLASTYISIINKIKIVHCRGHATAEVGLFLKKILGLKFIFDFRGLWVDERVDKGGWNLKNKLDYLQYRYYKNKERSMLSNSDQLVILTNKVIDEVVRLGKLDEHNIIVIPCCSDYRIFKPLSQEEKEKVREEIGIEKDDLVIGYLGSIGKMYRADAYLDLLVLVSNQNANTRGLVVTNDTFEFYELLKNSRYEKIKEIITVLSASRREVPRLIGSMDTMVSFIRPTYSKISSSPTKLAEAFACGIPVICNDRIGDIKEIMKNYNCGTLIPNLEINSLKIAAENLKNVKNFDGEYLRKISSIELSLDSAIKKYNEIYNKLEEQIKH